MPFVAVLCGRLSGFEKCVWIKQLEIIANTLSMFLKSPCDIECYCDRKEDDTANYIEFLVRMLTSNASLKG